MFRKSKIIGVIILFKIKFSIYVIEVLDYIMVFNIWGGVGNFNAFFKQYFTFVEIKIHRARKTKAVYSGLAIQHGSQQPFSWILAGSKRWTKEWEKFCSGKAEGFKDALTASCYPGELVNWLSRRGIPYDWVGVHTGLPLIDSNLETGIKIRQTVSY